MRLQNNESAVVRGRLPSLNAAKPEPPDIHDSNTPGHPDRLGQYPFFAGDISVCRCPVEIHPKQVPLPAQIFENSAVVEGVRTKNNREYELARSHTQALGDIPKLEMAEITANPCLNNAQARVQKERRESKGPREKRKSRGRRLPEKYVSSKARLKANLDTLFQTARLSTSRFLMRTGRMKSGISDPRRSDTLVDADSTPEAIDALGERTKIIGGCALGLQPSQNLVHQDKSPAKMVSLTLGHETLEVDKRPKAQHLTSRSNLTHRGYKKGAVDGSVSRLARTHFSQNTIIGGEVSALHILRRIPSNKSDIGTSKILPRSLSPMRNQRVRRSPPREAAKVSNEYLSFRLSSASYQTAHSSSPPQCTDRRSPPSQEAPSACPSNGSLSQFSNYSLHPPSPQESNYSGPRTARLISILEVQPKHHSSNIPWVRAADSQTPQLDKTSQRLLKSQKSLRKSQSKNTRATRGIENRSSGESDGRYRKSSENWKMTSGVTKEYSRETLYHPLTVKLGQQVATKTIGPKSSLGSSSISSSRRLNKQYQPASHIYRNSTSNHEPRTQIPLSKFNNAEPKRTETRKLRHFSPADKSLLVPKLTTQTLTPQPDLQQRSFSPSNFTQGSRPSSPSISQIQSHIFHDGSLTGHTSGSIGGIEIGEGLEIRRIEGKDIKMITLNRKGKRKDKRRNSDEDMRKVGLGMVRMQATRDREEEMCL